MFGGRRMKTAALAERRQAMTFRRAVVLIIAISVCAGLTACGPGGLPPITQVSQPISILFLIAPPSSLAINVSATVNAAVNNDSSAAVAWTLTCGGAGGCGSINPSQLPSGFNATYIAPSAIPAGGTVTVTATLVGDNTKSISATITITPPVSITVTFGGVPPASLQAGATVSVNATISNDVSANPQVQWTVTCAGGVCGSFNPVTTSSEAATNYTAPSAIPSGNTVTITATSVTDSTKSASATITISQAAATLANGTYVFQLSGSIGPESNFTAGVIVAQDGMITSGEEDYANFALDQTDQEYVSPAFAPIGNGSYMTTPDGNLQIAINSPAIGTITMNGVIVSSSRALITSVNGYIANGTLDLQSSKAVPSGGYALSTYGVDFNGQPAGVGGILNVDSAGGISGSGSVLDITDGTFVSGAQPLAASTVSSPDQFGRVVFQLFPQSSSIFSSLYLAGYIVDANHIRLVESSGDSFQGVMGGTALSQGTNTGAFSNSSLAGSSYVFGVAGEDMNGPLQVAGVFTAGAGGTLTGTLNWNDLTVKRVQSPVSFTGAYSVDPTGRVTLSKLTDGSTFTYQLQLYLTGSGEGLMLSSDTADLIAGRGLQQQTGGFTTADFNGTYGFDAAQVATSFGEFGPATALGPITVVAGTGTDALTGFVDFGNGTADVAVSGSVTAASSGVFTGSMSGLNLAAYTSPDNFAFYLIDESRAVVIETDNTQLTLGYLELQQ
jgi:hypothetical protein